VPQPPQPGEYVVITRGTDGQPQTKKVRFEDTLTREAEEVTRRQVEFTNNALNEELEKRRATLAELQGEYGPNHPELLQVRKQVAELEGKLRAAQRDSLEQIVTTEHQQQLQRQIELEQKRFAEMHENSGTLAAELAAEQARLESMLATFNESRFQTIAGRKLAAIEIRGLSEQAASDLLSRLSLHEGDTLTTESMESAERIAHEFDSHLEVNLGREPEGVVLRIHPAGAADAPMTHAK
jgi:hypothetical protein